MNKAFTIIEVLAAILVITIGVLAAYSIVQQIISYTLQSSSRLTAVYLAQEEIENIRNTRDNNWLDPTDPPWNQGIASTAWTPCGLTKYQKRITIDDSVADKLEVLVEIQWTEKGQTHTISVQENLYNWY